jgi:5-methylcytosine-specific restriction endonuclease McrA
MKNITPIAHNDSALLDWLSTYTRASCYPALAAEIDTVKSQYIEYAKYFGNPWSVAPANITPDLKSQIILQYDSKNTRFGFIKKIRHELSTLTCPLCGSLSLGTVDHFLPKEIYPEFSFYSKNLTPACGCNSRKGVQHRGVNAAERFLHPYFDKVLSERLLISNFRGDFSSPLIDIAPSNNGHKLIKTIEYHVKFIREKTNILNWLINDFANLVRSRNVILGNYLPLGALTKNDVKRGLVRKLRANDAEFDSKNNWKSVLIAGLLDNDDFVLEIHRLLNEDRGF